MDTGEEQVLSVLTRYVSPILARSMLTRALQRAGIRGHTTLIPHMARLTPLLADGAKLFVQGSLHGELVRLLESLAPAKLPREDIVRQFPVKSERDISTARSAARNAAEQLGARPLIAQRIATAVSELARNIVSYTPGGKIEFIPLKGERRGILIRATDSGTGISNLDKILSGNYRSTTGLGAGIRGTRRLADRFNIRTGASGTRVEAEFHF